jgi:hypothetical protein
MRAHRPTPAGLAAVVAAGLVAGGVGARTQQTFRSGVDLLPIDVVVLDADGRPVRGLTRDDFTVFADGEAVPIQTIAEVRQDPPPAAAWPPAVPRDVADNRDAAAERLVVIVLDDMFVDVDDTVKAAARDLILGLGGSFSIGLVTTSGRPGVEITQDPHRVLAFVEAFVDEHHRERGPPTAYTFMGSLHATKTVEDVARMVGANDGRHKVFVWIRSDQVSSTARDSIGMMEHLRRAGVTTYLLRPPGRVSRLSNVAYIERQRGVREPPSPTVDLERLLLELNNHYVLGIVPPASGGRNAYRRFDVRVNRPGLTVHHRHGYATRGPAPPPRNATLQGRLVAEVMPRIDLPLRLHAVPFFTAGSKLQVAVTLDVDLRELPPEDEDGEVAESLYYEVFAVSLEKKKIVTSVARELGIAWPRDADGATGAPRFEVRSVLELPPGPYQLRAAAIARRLALNGSAYLHVDVPEAQGTDLSLSGIAVAVADDPPGPRLIDAEPLAAMALPFRPSLERTFAPDGTLRVFFQVRRRSAATPASGTAALVDPDGVTVREVPWRVELASPPPDLRMPLEGLRPGAYRLVITATDGAHEAERQIGLRISGS